MPSAGRHHSDARGVSPRFRRPLSRGGESFPSQGGTKGRLSAVGLRLRVARNAKPHTSFMDIRETVAQFGGVVRTRQLRAHGFTPYEISRAVDDRRLSRVRLGVIAVNLDLPSTLAAAHGGQLACVSALKQRGVWVLPVAKGLHVGVASHARTFTHADCSCTDHHDQYSRGFGIASVRVALVQLAACQGDEAFFVALESAWNQGLLTRKDRDWIRGQVPARIRLLVDLARGDSESGLESLVRLRLFRLGLLVRAQVPVHGVGRVDFLIGQLIIEVDGRANHDGYSRRHKDLIRDADATAQGFRVLRFDYAMVMYDWPRVVAAILAALED